MRKIIVGLVIVLNGLTGCEKSPTSEVPVPTRKEVPRPVLSGPTLALRQSVTVSTGSDTIKLSNIGWCESLEGSETPEHCRLHDYTKVESDGRTGYLYRTYDWKWVDGKPHDRTVLMTSAVRPGLEELFQESSEKWDSADKAFPTATEHRTISWNHEAYLRFLELDHSLNTSICRDSEIRHHLINLKPRELGNVMVALGNVFYLDSAYNGIRTLLEIDNNGRLVGIATDLQTNRSYSAIKNVLLPKRSSDAREILPEPQNLTHAINPRLVTTASIFHSNCAQIYNAITKKIGLLNPGPIYQAYLPFFDATIDKKASDILNAKYARWKKTPAYNLYHTPTYYGAEHYPLAPARYLEQVPFVETVNPEDREAFLKAFPNPPSERDFQ